MILARPFSTTNAKRFDVLVRCIALIGCLCAGVVSQANATVLGFEGFAPSGGVTNVNPASPYQEQGFTMTPSNPLSAVFDAANPTTSFPGNPTSFFGFAPVNPITLTGSAPFDLISALIGPILGEGDPGPVNFTVQGNIFGGGTESVTFDNLTTATLENIDFTNLQSAVFTTSSDTGIDNIDLNVSSVPEPATLGLFAAGLGLLVMARRRSM